MKTRNKFIGDVSINPTLYADDDFSPVNGRENDASLENLDFEPSIVRPDKTAKKFNFERQNTGGFIVVKKDLSLATTNELASKGL